MASIQVCQLKFEPALLGEGPFLYCIKTFKEYYLGLGLGQWEEIFATCMTLGASGEEVGVN